MYIAVTGNGKLANELVKFSTKEKPIISLSKNEMDIRNEYEVLKGIEELSHSGLKYLIHTAAVGKPMEEIEKNPILGIETNIQGTINIAKACFKNNVKLIYISTDFVYEGKEDSVFPQYSEEDKIKPNNKYAWSKLGGECVTQLIPNSLILRCALTDIPFRHKGAFVNRWKSSITHENASSLILKLIDETGIINIGGTTQTVYDFVKQKQDIEKSWDLKNKSLNLSLNIEKLNKILNNGK